LQIKLTRGRLDTNFVYVAGSSAGGITALNVAYFDNSENNYFSPLQLNQLGLIDYGSFQSTARVKAAELFKQFFIYRAHNDTDHRR
jgi:hypothetical protein